MSNPPLVSIVTPSYNQARYLEETIRSVLAQRSAANGTFRLEYIIVDGASTDGSQEIISRYADQFAWWVSEADQGQAQAINKGFQHAQGEILGWLNSDDLYLPSAIQQAVEIFQTNPQLGLVFGDALSIDEQGHPIHRLSFGNWGLAELIRYRVICQPAVFFRRSAWDSVGGLDESYHYMLDHLLWIQIARQYPIQHISSLWAAARQHAQAKNVAQAARFGEEAQRIFEWMQSQPDLAEQVYKARNQVRGGVYRLRARYLLDGGFAAEALRVYFKALQENPTFALKHWHRILYAGLSLFGGSGLRRGYYKMSYRRNFNRLRNLPLNGWPGINLEDGELKNYG